MTTYPFTPVPQDFNIQVFKSREDAIFGLPAEGDVGFDLVCLERTAIRPCLPRFASSHETLWNYNQKVLSRNIVHINTHIRIALPIGYYGFVTMKSSVSAGNPDKGLPGGLMVLGGIIDNGYRGDIIVALANVSAHMQVIQAGQKIAQLIIMASPVLQPGINVNLKPVDTMEALGTTARGTGGFGSTGMLVETKPVESVG